MPDHFFVHTREQEEAWSICSSMRQYLVTKDYLIMILMVIIKTRRRDKLDLYLKSKCLITTFKISNINKSSFSFQNQNDKDENSSTIKPFFM